VTSSCFFIHTELGCTVNPTSDIELVLGEYHVILLDPSLVHCSSWWIDVAITSDGWANFEDMVYCPPVFLGWVIEEKKFKLKLHALLKWLAKLRFLLYRTVTFAGVIYITELYFIALKRSWNVLFTPSLMYIRIYSYNRFQSVLPKVLQIGDFRCPLYPSYIWSCESWLVDNLSGLYLGSTWTFCAYPHLLQAQPGIVPDIRPWSPSSSFFPVHYTWSSSCFILLCSLQLLTLWLPSQFCSIISQVPT